MDIGNRVYYKKSDGTLLYQTGEISGATGERPVDDEVAYIDVPFGSIDYERDWVIGVDLENGQPILETFKVETTEEKRIRELEDEILLQTENNVGGYFMTIVNQVVVRIAAERIMAEGLNPKTGEVYLLDDITNPDYRQAVEDYILTNTDEI